MFVIFIHTYIFGEYIGFVVNEMMQVEWDADTQSEIYQRGNFDYAWKSLIIAD